MRVLVCGGRDFDDYDLLEETLTNLFNEHNLWTEGVIIHGAAKGADSLASVWADVEDIEEWAYPAKWSEEGKAAGPLRNIRMLKEGKPDLVVAFPGGKGTAHMVKIAKEAGIKVIEVSDG